jgi:hypothetical protein
MLLSFLFFVNALAFGPSEKYMTLAEQETFIEQKAKNIRREYHIGGYEDVSSSSVFFNKRKLDEYVKLADTYESFLDSDEVSQLYSCVAKENCELYLITVDSSYYSGSGTVAHFVMLYTATRKSFTLKHTIYAE